MKMPQYVRTSNLFNISILFLSLVLTGCEFGSTESTSTQKENTTQPDIQLRFVTPSLLRAPTVTGLGAYVTIDSGEPIELTVNPDNTVTGTIENVAVGEREIIITYYVIYSSVQVTLATVTTRVTVNEGQTSQTTVNDDDLNRDIDDDNDGYTNLAEVRSGTSPLDKFDLPTGDLPLYSVGDASFGNAISASGYEMKYRVGEPVNGTSISTNFKVVSGFHSH